MLLRSDPGCAGNIVLAMTTYRFTDAHGAVFVEELESDDCARTHAKSTFPYLGQGVTIERQRWVRIEYYDVQQEP